MAKCDFCADEAVYDAKTVMGPWAFLCEAHWEKYGTNIRTKIAKEIGVKRCINCNKEKPLSQFYRYTDSRGVIRHRTDCKECNLLGKKIARIKEGLRNGKH